jgi:hypothetical protein
MLAILCLLTTFATDLFRSRRQLEVENLFLRHQLNIALRHAPRRLRLHGSDRAVLVWLTRLWPSLIGLARVVQPDTILRWHRSGFRAYWRWKSCGQPGRPRVSYELRDLIRQSSPFASPPRAKLARWLLFATRHFAGSMLGAAIRPGQKNLIPPRLQRTGSSACSRSRWIQGADTRLDRRVKRG